MGSQAKIVSISSGEEIEIVECQEAARRVESLLRKLPTGQ
jgi:hypothetical protein